uniref:Uncharacterized protein n=1 Tax=Meloidogyne incognita TaxID=6306 RepID=A0A914KLR3_MELIC
MMAHSEVEYDANSLKNIGSSISSDPPLPTTLFSKNSFKLNSTCLQKCSPATSNSIIQKINSKQRARFQRTLKNCERILIKKILIVGVPHSTGEEKLQKSGIFFP